MGRRMDAGCREVAGLVQLEIESAQVVCLRRIHTIIHSGLRMPGCSDAGKSSVNARTIRVVALT